MKKTLLSLLALMLMAATQGAWAQTLSTDDSGAYIIASATDWATFCTNVSSGNTFSGKTVKMTNDITVSQMVGSQGKDFKGTFDGQQHTLTFNYTATEGWCGLFKNVESGCVIQNLHVAGTINTAYRYVGGLICVPNGTVKILNCRVSTVINSTISGDGTHGGFVAQPGNYSTTKLTIEGCIFDGKLLGSSTTCCGGFVGYRSANSSVTIKNSLFAPAELTVSTTGCATLARNGATTLRNGYYLTALNTAQGKQARSITAGSFVTSLAIDDEGTEYSVSGITAYDLGIKYNGTYYAGKDDEVALALSYADKAGYKFKEYAPSAGTLSGTTLTMPDADVEVEAAYYTILKEDFATAYDPLTNQHIDLWIERTLQAGSYNTLALPFGMNLGVFKSKIGDPYVKVKELTGASVSGKTLTLTFSDATEIVACKPYLVKLSGSESVTLGAFDDVFMLPPVEPQTISYDAVDFIPTLGLKTLPEGRKNILFIGAANKLYHPSDEGQQMKGFRAYFKLKGEAANAQSFAIDFGEGEATAIEAVQEFKSLNVQEFNADNAYNLGGQRVSEGYKGIVIVNGKKVIK